MTHEPRLPTLHPVGEQLPVEISAPGAPVTLDTFAGPVKVEWDSSSPLSPLGQIVYFIEFLKVSDRLDAAIEDCPLVYTSPNAPAVRDVICTWVLSILAGHKRYAHITALRCDSVLAELMGMSKIVSEDSVRRALKAMPEANGLEWQQQHIDQCTHPLLGERYIIDIDVTVKPLYGHQEGAVVTPDQVRGRPTFACASHLHAGGASPSPGGGDGTRQRAHRCTFGSRIVGAAGAHPARLLAHLIARR